MKKTVLMLMVILVMGMAQIYCQETGDLNELMGHLSKAKGRLSQLESGDRPLGGIVLWTDDISKSINEAKTLLRRYNYPNKSDIQKQVNDTETRFANFVSAMNKVSVNLPELLNLIGDIKLKLSEFENKKTLSAWDMGILSKNINNVKLLLELNDYPNKAEFQKQISELEQRYSKAILSM